MCLIAFAFDAHPDYALVLAANRDEFYDRPTAPAHFWPDEAPGLLAGRDEQAGGTWMGVTRAGRFAALTNVRAPSARRAPDAPSRGGLVTDFLQDDRSPEAFLNALAPSADRYNGFNLLAGTFAADAELQLAYFSNHAGAHADGSRADGSRADGSRAGGSPENALPRRVPPGVHGLSNASLDTPWPKVKTTKAALRRLLSEERNATPEALLELLDDRTPAPEAALPDTGVPPGLERALSPVFIQTDGYGTRSSTALLVGRGGAVTFAERSFEEGHAPADCRFSFQVQPAEAQAATE